MTTIQQDPEITSNVEIKVPKKIVIEYKHPHGWYIEIDGSVVDEDVPGQPPPPAGSPRIRRPTYFNDFEKAMDWCDERQLIKTASTAKAIETKIKKVHKKAQKKAA